MQHQDKKRIQDRIRKVITDAFLKIDTLLSNFSENKPEANAKRFFHIVKYTFGELFNIHYEYTYEELIEKLTTLNRKLSSISAAIKELKTKIDDTFIDEKNNPRLKEKIDELEEKLLKEHQLEKFYTKLKSILSHENLNELIKELSHNISSLEYGNEKISNEELTGLINKFKLILDKILSFEEIQEKKQKKNFFAWFLHFFGLRHEENVKPKIEEPELAPKLDTSKQPQTKKKEEVAPKKEILQKTEQISQKILEILELIEQTKQSMNKGNIHKAKKQYLKILNIYKKLKLEEKEQTYRQLLQLYHSLINFDSNAQKK